MICRASLVAQLVKNLPALWETWVRSLGWEDPLEEGSCHPPVFRPGEGELHRLYSPWGRRESDATERLSLFHSLSLSLCLSLCVCVCVCVCVYLGLD